MTNIRDVARLAGVSISTVSNLINNRSDRMTGETWLKVESAMNELGYAHKKKPIQKTDENKIIGLLIPSLANPSFAGLAHELERAAALMNYRIILGSCYREKEKESKFINDMFNLNVHGTIVASSDIRQTHYVNALQRGMAFLSYDNSNHMLSDEAVRLFDSVSMDNFDAGKMAAEHLLERGCKNIIFVTESTLTVGRNQKISGFFSKLGISHDEYKSRLIEVKALQRYGDAEMFKLGLSVSETIVKNNKKPDGIVTINDALGIGLMTGLRAAGLKIPGDISIIGIDNIALSAFTEPGLASVSPPIENMAKLMIRRIIERINNDQSVPMEFLFKPTIVFRTSVRNVLS